MAYGDMARDMGVDKKAQHSKIPLTASGLTLFATSYFSNLYFTNSSFKLVMGLGLVIGVYGFFTEMKKKEETLFINAGLNIGAMYPKTIDKQKVDDNITNYIISMPKGLCVGDFKARKEIIEQGLNASVEFTFNKNLIMKTNKAQLQTLYNFEPHALEGLKITLGYNKFGLQILDLENAPHVIVAGTTGSGKSVCLRNIITQLVLTKNIDMYLYDAQRVELGLFKNCKPCKGFYSEPEQMLQLLLKLEIESKRRTTLFEGVGVTNLTDYNKKLPKLKRIMVIVDEFVLLSKNKAISEELRKRVSVDRKVGIHYILCTQRPSRDVIDSDIKANIPCRICFKTSSDQDSEIVFDQKGAEKLKGKGHGLMKSNKCDIDEFQGYWLNENLATQLIKPFSEVKRAERVLKVDTSGRK